jgi:hypothetical protein
VTFDSVVTLFPNGTGAFIDIILGDASKPLDPSASSIFGATISVSTPASLLPSRGLDFADYRYNLWPRFGPAGINPGDNTQISDFAPDASNFVACVPEPASLILLATGIAELAVAGGHRPW